MNVFFQVYLMSAIALAILAGFLIIVYHILQGREEE